MFIEGFGGFRRKMTETTLRGFSRENPEEACFLGKEKGIFDCEGCYAKLVCAKKGAVKRGE